MASSSTLTLSSTINEALDYLHRYQERPAQFVVGSDALTALSTDTTCTAAAGTKVPSITDVVEIGSELMLVTAVSSDATPIITVSRGYLGTTIAAHATGAVGGINPMYPRYLVQRTIQRCFQNLGADIPNITSDTFFRDTGKQYVTMDDDTIQVLEVGYLNTSTALVGAANTFRYTEIGGWLFVEDLPIQVAVTGKLLRVPSWVQDDLELIVKRQVAYSWSTNPISETATIQVPLGGEDLPVLFTAARLITGREISRSEIDKVEEWNQEAAIRGGVNLRLVRMLWQDYFDRVEKCRSLQYVPKHRPYRKVHSLPVRKPVLVR